QYYAAKAYAGQLNKGKETDGQYQNLKEIIFLLLFWNFLSLIRLLMMNW
ncbi:MAG: hypothetical protein RLZZ59_848, partial [Pseudomonadota bacterium]